MCACPVRNCVSLLNVFLLESLKRSVGLSLGGILFAGWNPNPGHVAWLFQRWVHSSSISLLWRDAMNAWVLWSRWSGLSFAPSLASRSASLLPTMLECPGTQLMAISASFTSSRIPLMCLLKVRDCFWAFRPISIEDKLLGRLHSHAESSHFGIIHFGLFSQHSLGFEDLVAHVVSGNSIAGLSSPVSLCEGA